MYSVASLKMMSAEWRKACVVLALLILSTGILYSQTVTYLVHLWNDFSIGEYGHGYLVLAISAYLIFFNKEKLSRVSPCPDYSILPLVLLSGLSWLVAVLVDVEMLQTVGLLLTIFTLTWAVIGHRAMAFLAFPLLYIGFALPVWFPLSPLLQDLTADVVFWMARLIEVPAFRQENLIVVPSGTFSIEEACSGMRYFLAALTLGALYAYINYVTFFARVSVIFVAVVAAVVANILRVFIVVYVGYTTEMQHPWVTDHLMLGWYLFGGLVAALLFLDAKLYRRTADDGEITEKVETIPCRKGRFPFFVIAIISGVLISIGPIVIHLKNNQKYPPIENYALVFPGGFAPWDGPYKSTNDWMPVYKGAISQKMDYTKELSTSSSDDVVSVFIAYYPWQKQGQEVINDLNSISNHEVWHSKYAHAKNRQVKEINIKEQLIENRQLKQRLVWYWYDIAGRQTSNKYEAKLLQLLAMLRLSPQAYAVALSIEIDGSEKEARMNLLTFMSKMEKPLANIQIIENHLK